MIDSQGLMKVMHMITVHAAGDGMQRAPTQGATQVLKRACRFEGHNRISLKPSAKHCCHWRAGDVGEEGRGTVHPAARRGLQLGVTWPGMTGDSVVLICTLR
jgi:hypothetical protein